VGVHNGLVICAQFVGVNNGLVFLGVHNLWVCTIDCKLAASPWRLGC
jgi:hypothetical protein